MAKPTSTGNRRSRLRLAAVLAAVAVGIVAALAGGAFAQVSTDQQDYSLANQTEAVACREEELAEGHAAVRFAGYVTVSARTLDELEHHCSEIEHAAQMSTLELLRLYGPQAAAFTYTLPLCRGLR